MNKFLKTLYERLAERMAALFGKLMASHVQTMHAEQEAECQSRLEELARKYEAQGQPEIAATLRQRARSLVGDSPLGLGAALLDQLGTSAAPVPPPATQQAALPEAPPEVPHAPKTGRRKLTLPPAPSPTEEGQP